jgi:hypothetical protein
MHKSGLGSFNYGSVFWDTRGMGAKGFNTRSLEKGPRLFGPFRL